MQLKVNGKPFELQGKTAADLIQQLDYGNTRIALEVNATIVPKSSYGEFALSANDKIEIIKAVGGG